MIAETSQEEKPIYLAGFSIDQSVRLSIIEYRRSKDDPIDIDFMKSERTRTISEDIEPLARGNRSAQIKKSIHSLLDKAAEKIDFYKLDALAVSCIGTISERRKLIDVSLSVPNSDWAEDSGAPVSVDFLTVVQGSIDLIQSKLKRRKKLLKTMVNFVAANDAKAGAEAISYIQETGHDYVYVPINSGVNVGVVIFNQLVLRDQHPEFGHFYPPLHPSDISRGFQGTCARHGTCLEGLVSIPSFLERRGMMPGWRGLSLDDLMKQDEARDICTHYLAHLFYNITLAFAPKKIIASSTFITQSLIDESVSKMRLGLMAKDSDAGGRMNVYPAFPCILEDGYVERSKSALPIDNITGALTLAFLLHRKHTRLPSGEGGLANDMASRPSRTKCIEPNSGFLGPNVIHIEDERRKIASRDYDDD